MERARLSALFATACLGSAALALPAHAQAPVWEENFDGPSIDGDNWTYDVGNGCQIGLCGWGNSELQYYTSRPENARIENGHLVIEARREDFGGMPYTSARMKTEGRMHFKYGTLEARIKIPEVGNGLWPAYWMLGVAGVWPARGEIDLMEAGSAQAIAEGVVNRRVGAAVHWDYQGSQADYGADYTSAVDLDDDYHVYRMDWTPQYIRVSIDGQQYFDFDISNPDASSTHEFHAQQYLLLNLAVGGAYTGIFSPDGITAPVPGRMEVDYIRLYQDVAGSELYVGADSATPPGRFGVYSEQAGLAGHLDYNGEANLYLWNNLTPISAQPFEGGQVMAFRAGAGAWYGLGVANDVRNMGNYAGGWLKFRMRTTTATTFKIGINTSFGDSWVDFVNGGNNYGLVRDGQWHEVSIPFSAFYDLDLNAVKQMFMVVADPPGESVEFFIDDVYYQSP
ncbi:glycoside hydrolase family 16 protein [Coralloluteibacterium stylophorae]|uniref:Glycoside hydrolase family 16 protein n=1 Tax=Coralloluteibacterium stylophorae TaxID=1776034 RepID=A0A8J7VW33_9GAMM|nr:glycoside hydrolase family 16 protein [Coralloluteibacterium stylophorae]MBS7458669.1 glycoside hydrolase family 16 protein [Coralloluteibacterium stylophorae]